MRRLACSNIPGCARRDGISKAGNRWARALAINTAWAWLCVQPQSALSRWYQEKFGKGNSRMRKIGIVALARKLLIAFWRYLDAGIIPGRVPCSAPNPRATRRIPSSTGSGPRLRSGLRGLALCTVR